MEFMAQETWQEGWQRNSVYLQTANWIKKKSLKVRVPDRKWKSLVGGGRSAECRWYPRGGLGEKWAGVRPGAPTLEESRGGRMRVPGVWGKTPSVFVLGKLQLQSERGEDPGAQPTPPEPGGMWGALNLLLSTYSSWEGDTQ
jgi:hypothetical protein